MSKIFCQLSVREVHSWLVLRMHIVLFDHFYISNCTSHEQLTESIRTIATVLC